MDEECLVSSGKILRDQYKYTYLITASCDDPKFSLKQQGGIFIGTTGKVVGMLGNKGVDPRGLGR